ncbi:MAG: MogA/MoaB family molybdenum cofactor biosynthesis protein [Synergistales bacterium]|nr:MogA/MoaB family molybdenum cofactor biosynthesis protein [Synergistales bacterium]
MARILRLLHYPDICDAFVMFVHSNEDGSPMVNGIPKTIWAVPPGRDIQAVGDAEQDALLVTVEDFEQLQPGRFLATEDDGCVLSVGSPVNGAVPLEVVQQAFLTLSQRVSAVAPLRTGILTVSDRGSRGERQDTSGPALAQRARTIGCSVEAQRIVPDEKNAITDALRGWTEKDALHLILITGGTGLSDRDITPDVLSQMGERVIPGIGEYMRWKGTFSTMHSILSRGVAVTVGPTLVVSLPGSKRGALECFDAVAPALRHGIETIGGWTEDCGH